MPNPDRPSFSANTALQWILFALLGSTTLVVTINSYDSGITKTPLLVIFASLLLTVFFSHAVWTQRLRLRQSPTDIPVLLFLALVVASTIFSKHWASEQAFAVWISYIICFFAGTHLFSKARSLDKLIGALAIISALVSFVGLLQFFFSDRLFLEFFIDSDRRVSSTLTNATYLSGYVVLLFPVLLAFTVMKERTPWQRWALGTLLCGLVFVLVVTSTRSSIAAFAISVIVFGILSGHARKRVFTLTVAGVLVAAAVAVLLSPNLIERIETSFRNDSQSTLARRMYFWEAGRDAFEAAPFFGHGIGSFETVMLQYRSSDYWVVKSEDVVPHAHNEFIETAVELGGTGLISYLLILGTLAVAGTKAGTKEGERDRILRTGLLCSLIAIAVDNLTNLSLRVVPVGATAWLLMGVLASFPSRKLPETEKRVLLPRWSAGIPLLAWLVFFSWYGNQQLNIYRADGHIIKGILSGRAHKLGESINEYKQAIALNPRSLLAYSNLTLTLLMADNPEEAVKTARQLRALSPLYPKSNLMEAAALVSLQRYKEALQSIDVELKLRSHPDAYYYRAIACKGLADSTGELYSLEHLLLASIKGRIPYQLRPISSRILELAQKKEDIQRLTPIYVQLVSLFPSEPSPKNTLTELQQRSTRTEKPVLP